MINQRIAVASLLAVSATLGIGLACGGSDESNGDATSRPQQASGQPLSIAEALVLRPASVFRIRAGLLVRRNEKIRLCSSLGTGRPPRCGKPALTLEGMGNPYRVFEGIEKIDDGQGPEPAAGWGEPVELSGKLEGESVFRHLPPQKSQRVIDHFRKRTGDELVHDLFLSNDEIDHVNLESSRDARAVRSAQAKWGSFDIVIPLTSGGNPIEIVRTQLDPYVIDATGKPDRRGIRWLRLRRLGWVALSGYKHGVVLQWTSGRTRQIDARWKRLDAVLESLR
jgi:hypothetical protein